MERQLITTDELKEIQYDILCYVKKVCDENNLTYYLCGGTMLGAVRHKGYIPWDDDIDLLMFRDDLDKLVDILKNGEIYRSFSYTTNQDYFFPFVKICDLRTEFHEKPYLDIKDRGVNIDIFPLDYFPNSPKDVNRLIKKHKFYRTMLGYAIDETPKFSFAPRKAAKYIVLKFAQTVSWKKWLDKLNNVVLQYSHDDNPKYAGNIVWGYGKKEMIPVEAFSSTVDLLFEKEMFKCPVDYDTYLRCLFDDYMQLPPEDQRITHHSFEAYRK